MQVADAHVREEAKEVGVQVQDSSRAVTERLASPHVAATVIAAASGATVLSHVNDSGFWLVSRYLGMTEKQTLRVWTVMETIVGVTGFAVVVLLSLFI